MKYNYLVAYYGTGAEGECHAGRVVAAKGKPIKSVEDLVETERDLLAETGMVSIGIQSYQLINKTPWWKRW